MHVAHSATVMHPGWYAFLIFPGVILSVLRWRVFVRCPVWTTHAGQSPAELVLLETCPAGIVWLWHIDT